MKGLRFKTFILAVLVLLILTIMVIQRNLEKKEIISVYIDTYNKIQVEMSSLALSLDEEIDSIDKLEKEELEDIIDIIKDSERSLYLYSKDLPMSIDFDTKEMLELLLYDFSRLPNALERCLLEKSQNRSLSLREMKMLSNSLQELCSTLKIEDISREDYSVILTKSNIINKYIEILEAGIN